ncbi:MAG: hypothetical protein EZS28_055353, partial [Streblomastix strix]
RVAIGSLANTVIAIKLVLELLGVNYPQQLIYGKGLYSQMYGQCGRPAKQFQAYGACGNGFLCQLGYVDLVVELQRVQLIINTDKSSAMRQFLLGLENFAALVQQGPLRSELLVKRQVLYLEFLLKSQLVLRHVWQGSGVCLPDYTAIVNFYLTQVGPCPSSA